jgi:hypothetical protein
VGLGEPNATAVVRFKNSDSGETHDVEVTNYIEAVYSKLQTDQGFEIAWLDDGGWHTIYGAGSGRTWDSWELVR